MVTNFFNLLSDLSPEQRETYSQRRKGKTVGSVLKACTRKYNHIGILRNSAYIQVGAAPKRVWGPLSFI